MDYIGNKCPVCNKYFHADDDIVVCPECGTPHHRECYEQTGHCIHEDLHAQGYDYETEQNENPSAAKICPQCGAKADDDSFFCKKCGAPLSPGQNTNTQRNSAPPFGGNAQQGDAQSGNPMFSTFMDPLGGVPSDTDLGDGVTAGEAAKYVKQNTPYFIRIFSNIKNFNRSKFNFSAALFTGGYLLYRKMYKLGALFTSLQLLLLVVETYMTIAFSSLYNQFYSVIQESSGMTEMLTNYNAYLAERSFTELMILYLPTFIDIARIAMMIVLGICCNLMYFKHCKKQINRIKSTAKPGENPESTLQTKGGVNTPLAISLLITYLIISYLPTIITMFG